jgi:hypothetical protein
MSDSNTAMNLLREILRSDRNNTASERAQPTREELVRRDYENMFKLINEYQYTMTEYQNNMHTYLLLLSSLQLQMPSFATASGATETRAPPVSQSFRPPTSRRNGNRVNTAFRPMNSNPLPPVQPTTTSASETRRMFDSLARISPRTTDLSGSGMIPMTARVATTASSSGNSASPAVNLIDVVFEYDGSMLGNETDTAVQHLIDNDDFRNSILRAAGIEGGDNMMHWVMTPQYAGAEEEPRGLTNEEIYRYTELLIFREDLEGLLSNTCPITMEEYVVGDRLLQLHTCRHAFRERELVEWFQRERTCPVCRTLYG